MAYRPAKDTPAYRSKTHKVCTKCKRELLVSEFYKRDREEKKLIPVCIQCTKEKYRQYYATKKEKIIERVRSAQKVRAEEERQLDETAVRIPITRVSAEAEVAKRAIIGRALWDGRIRLAEACQICGAQEPITPLVQGEWKDLSQTRITWCCALCKDGVEKVGLRSQAKRMKGATMEA